MLSPLGVAISTVDIRLEKWISNGETVTGLILKVEIAISVLSQFRLPSAELNSLRVVGDLICLFNCSGSVDVQVHDTATSHGLK